MSYDVLIDHIIEEAGKRRGEILAEARKKADAMLMELKDMVDHIQERAFSNVKKDLDDYRVKELNRARHRGKAFISAAKGEVVDAVFKEVDNAFHSIIEGPAYPSILKNFLTEGLQEVKGKVHVIANSRDCPLVKDILKDVSFTGCEVLSVKEDDRINAGVEMLSYDNSISIINTLWSRFDKVREDMMPQLREILFTDKNDA
jgi:vacuolar-type H+-ATPase subunit E/Vma4